MLKNKRIAIINASLGLALIFSLLPQYWPAAEIYSRYIVVFCALAAICSYLLGLNGSECADSDIEKRNVRVDQERNHEPTKLASEGEAHVRLAAAWRLHADDELASDWLTLLDSFRKVPEIKSQMMTEQIEPFDVDWGATNETVTLGILAFQIKDNKATIHVMSSKKSPSKVARSQYPLYTVGQQFRLPRRVLH